MLATMRACLICDDHAMMREALAGAVTLHWPETIITQAHDFPQAQAAITADPCLCLCDLTMPGATPLEGIAALRAAAPQVPLLVVTGNEDDALLLALFDLGIAGFVPKSARAPVIESAIRLVLAGERYVPPRILGLASARPAPPAGSSVRLTDRQLDVLRLVAEGQSNKEIARALALSPATIKTHTAAAIATLGASNRTEAVYKARTLRLL